MTLDEYIAQEKARDSEFAREYDSPAREIFFAGVAVHVRRKEAGISLPKLAKKSRVPLARLRAFELGDPSVSYDEFCAILDALGDSPQPQPLADLRIAGRARFAQLQIA